MVESHEQLDERNLAYPGSFIIAVRELPSIYFCQGMGGKP
jgi:hypothetical protein